MDDIYYIPTNATEGLYKEKGSKFFAYQFPIFSIQDAEDRLLDLKKLHPKSRHACYAYRLSPKEQNFRINDDGEPSGTAGKPIFNQILSANLHNVLVVVIRYFGGTKLGASGLIRAYKTSAEEACKLAEKLEKYDTTPCKLHFDYAKMGDVMNAVKSQNLEIADKSFDLNPYLLINLRESIFQLQINQLKAIFLHRDIEDIKEDTEVEKISFELI